MSRSILAGAAALFAAVAAFGQAPPPAAPQTGGWHAKNLKVLPADIPRDKLIGVMRGFTVGLGVKCTYCHVGEEGKRETMDFPSDAKKEKATARLMMAMVRRINEQDFAVKDSAQVKVTCFTCHRGAEKPLVAPPPAVPPAAS